MSPLPLIVPTLLALYLPFCTRVATFSIPASQDQIRSLWEAPLDLEQRDLFFGPWGPERAPDPHAVYTLVEHKHTGVNPGMTVRDAAGRQWSVKQAADEGEPPEGPIEVVVSRILSAIGYHQPPVYFVSEFTLADDWGRRREGGGRFRLKDQSLKDRGDWSWQRTPLVGTQPYQGLLVVLMLVGSSDLKNDNNTLYEHRAGDRSDAWLVVRDLGMALGTTGRFAPLRGNADALAREPFITGVSDGFVEFEYHGWHQELVKKRITPADVGWAADLLGRITIDQWHDAFRAGGFTVAEAQPFIVAIRSRIGQAMRVGREHRAAAPAFGERQKP